MKKSVISIVKTAQRNFQFMPDHFLKGPQGIMSQMESFFNSPFENQLFSSANMKPKRVMNPRVKKVMPKPKISKSLSNFMNNPRLCDEADEEEELKRKEQEAITKYASPSQDPISLDRLVNQPASRCVVPHNLRAPKDETDDIELKKKDAVAFVRQ